MEWKHNLKNNRLTALPKWPQQCLLCDESGNNNLCKHCQNFFDTSTTYCKRCALPMAKTVTQCGDCLKLKPAYDNSFAAYLYQAPLSTLINRFKHNRDLVAGEALSSLFVNALLERGFISNTKVSNTLDPNQLPDKIVAMPLPWQRQWSRGFNQAQLFADRIALAVKRPVLYGVRKVRRTPPQESLARVKRLNNLHDSFTVPHPLTGQSVAIVDDVMTTGASTHSLAKALKKAGATSVSVWVLARTPKGSFS